MFPRLTQVTASHIANMRRCWLLHAQGSMLYHSKADIYGFKPETYSDPPFNVDSSILQKQQKHSNIYRLVQAYRMHGNKKAVLDPLGLKPQQTVTELNSERYGVTEQDSQKLDLKELYYGATEAISGSELIKALDRQYCGAITAEFEHLSTEEEREWFAKRFETKSDIQYTQDRKVNVAKLKLKALAFDNFLASKFTTLKRYGGEGAESMLCVLDEVFLKSCEGGITHVVIGMPHRGRLSFLAAMLDYPVATIFRKVKGMSEFPPGVEGTGDVLSHFYKSVDMDYGGKKVHVSLLPNPSHLDAVSPVAVGKARGKQQTLKTGDYSKENPPSDQVLCVQIHGDGSFSGQGVIAETLCFARAPHFNIGGSVHLIVNNQLGYTTEEHYGRSSLYCTDVAKMNSCPVIHVNGEKPEDVLRATCIAMDYRTKFKKDVLVELVCYRKAGHNEMDEPSFTQPLMYQAIRGRTSVPDLYAAEVVSAGLCTQEDLEKNVSDWVTHLNKEFSQLSNPVEPYHLLDQWSGCVQASREQITSWETGVDQSLLKYVGAKSVEVSSSVHVHPTIQKTHIDRRLQRLEEGANLDWSTGEALAIGSLLYQGFNVRICGQDVGRGTFSQRHAIIVDQSSDEITIPLNNLLPDQKGFLEMANSVLSEEAVLGFEYGMSLESPDNLCIWEAQFGDFFNGAQIMIDAFITSGENKWLLQSGLVLLLPHGYDGAGPEHTSCRIERFLQMTDSQEDGVDADNVNFQVANPTTPAQYFHLLRQQVIRNYRKPLVLAAPKILLRYPAAVSTLADMSPGTSFCPVLPDPDVTSGQVKKLVFCSGKHYYALHKEREVRDRMDMAFIRLESLCPFPAASLKEHIDKYPKATEFIWSQEEHRNMGAWSFVSPRFQNILGLKLKYVGRGVLGLPAVGIGEIHQREMQEILDQTFQ